MNQNHPIYRKENDMKRTLLLVCTALLASALLACGEGEGVETEKKDTTPITQAPTEAPETVPDTEAAFLESATAQVTDAPTEAVTEPKMTGEPETMAPYEPTEQYPEKYAYINYDFYTRYKGTILEATERADEEYLKSIVFLGDSTTNGLWSYGMLPDGKNSTQVWLPKDKTLTLWDVPNKKILDPNTNTEVVFSELIALRKPKILVITLGVNGVAFLDEAGFKREYGKILDTVLEKSPETQIILQSIFPVTREYNLLKQINNNNISRANVWVADLAEQYGIAYLNTAEILLNEHGYLFTDMDSGDGLHLLPDTYQKIIDYILCHRLPKK